MLANFFSLKQLENMAKSYTDCTGVPVTVFDEEMVIIAEAGREMKVCKFSEIYNKAGACIKVLKFSGEMALNLGEPYIYSCPAGFLHICVALINDKKFQGCFIAGPISMNTISEKNISTIIELNEGNANMQEFLPKLTLFIKDMPIYTPSRISSLSQLLFNTVLSLYSNKEDYLYMSTKYNTYSQISEDIKNYKEAQRLSTEKLAQNAAEDMVRELQKRIRSRDREGAYHLANMVLEDIRLSEAGNFEVMKLRLFELYITLSRSGVESGASIQKVFGINFDLVASLNSILTVPQLQEWAQKVVDHFIDNVFSSIYSGRSLIIANAIRHINTNYMTKINLKNLAELLHVNESYLSKLFKQEMGQNFTDYLNEIRINKSLSLIRDTDNNLLDIALAVGFEDQSYYTKVFRKVMNQTPKQYRNGRISA